MKLLLTFCSLFVFVSLNAQFAPPDGQPGTTAMYKDSSAFVGWANTATIKRGWQDSNDTSLGYTTVGDSTSCLGKSDNTVVSLGDGGEAIVSFNTPIYDGPGWDFAVFENSFVNNFLELAFVEVSSNGLDFYRFPAVSLTQDTLQVGPFGFLDATKINNLAGKYRGTYGTPFDLSELSIYPNLNLQNITHVKIIDVVGSIQDAYGTRDTSTHFINDPWPTPFPSSGFDLEAVGVIHAKGIGLEELSRFIRIYPVPANNYLRIDADETLEGSYSIAIFNLQGVKVFAETHNFAISKNLNLDLSGLSNGNYIFTLRNENGVLRKPISIVR